MVKLRYQVIWDDEAKASLRKVYDHIKKRESIDQAIKVRILYYLGCQCVILN